MSNNGGDFPWWLKVVIGAVIFTCAGLAFKFGYDYVIKPTTTITSK